MRSEAFDAVTRQAGAESSRRGLLRRGLGAVTAAALAGLGLSLGAADVDARRRRPNQARCKRDEQCRSRICGRNRLGRVCCVAAGGHCKADDDCCGRTSRCDLISTQTCYTP